MLSTSYAQSASAFGKGDGLMDLFVNVPPEDDFFEGIAHSGFDMNKQVGDPKSMNDSDYQRASIASTECPASFALSTCGPSFLGVDGGGSFGGFESCQDGEASLDSFVDVMSTSAFARRMQNLGGKKAVAPPGLGDAPAASAVLGGPRCPPPAMPPPIAPASLAPESQTLLAEVPEVPGAGDDAPSIGSRLHAIGECTPCKFFRGRRGCKDGMNCLLCHHKHDELTYSGIRRIMRKKGLEKRGITEADTTTPSTPSVSSETMAPSFMIAGVPLPPPPGLPEPDRQAFPQLWPGMSAAFMGACC